jgi:DNA-binding NarL/FixJ family response regulator
LRAAESELRARGTRSDAERLLRSAFEAADALGAMPLLRELTALARRARVTLASVPAPEAGTADVPAPVVEAAPDDAAAALRRAGLSDREIEVLRLVAAGRSNGQIAERLFIARKTAGVHVTHILDKLGVANRVEAAMVAARLGLEADAEEG